jgi:hypothetical protein
MESSWLAVLSKEGLLYIIEELMSNAKLKKIINIAEFAIR